MSLLSIVPYHCSQLLCITALYHGHNDLPCILWFPGKIRRHNGTLADSTWVMKVALLSCARKRYGHIFLVDKLRLRCTHSSRAHKQRDKSKRNAQEMHTSIEMHSLITWSQAKGKIFHSQLQNFRGRPAYLGMMLQSTQNFEIFLFKQRL